MSPAMFVPLLVLGILVINALVWIPIILGMKKKHRERTAAIEAELRGSTTGERLLCGPVVATTRRGHGSFRATVALTNQRVIIASSTRADIPLSEVLDARTLRTFNGNVRGGYKWVILQMTGKEIGIAIRTDEHARWLESTKGALAERALNAPSKVTL